VRITASYQKLNNKRRNGIETFLCVRKVKAVTKRTKCLSYVDDDDDIVSEGKLTADNG